MILAPHLVRHMRNQMMHADKGKGRVLLYQLKAIIDEQRINAQETIKNLESIQEYTPPRKDFTKETLDSM